MSASASETKIETITGEPMPTIIYPENEALRFVIQEQKKEIEELKDKTLELEEFKFKYEDLCR